VRTYTTYVQRMYNVCTTYVQRMYNVVYNVEYYVEHYFEHVTYTNTSWKLQTHKVEPIKGGAA